MDWALRNKVKEVIVLDGIAVEGLPDSKRMPIILSSGGGEADEASLIHDNSINVTRKGEEKMGVIVALLSDYGFCRRNVWREFYPPVYQTV